MCRFEYKNTDSATMVTLIFHKYTGMTCFGNIILQRIIQNEKYRLNHTDVYGDAVYYFVLKVIITQRTVDTIVLYSFDKNK